MNAEEFRQHVMHQGLSQKELYTDPFKQFEAWYGQTLESDIPEPTAMVLATIDADGQPWQRTVLLKLFDEDGFVFYTNYESRKAGHIANDPRVSLLFPWHALGRQVKITGVAEKISTAESLKYFASRPRGSQIGAWASTQSKVISSRAMLDGMFEKMKHKFANHEVPLPDFWGGYRVRPDTLEFWQARENRLHDCFLYTQDDAGQWQSERLAP